MHLLKAWEVGPIGNPLRDLSTNFAAQPSADDAPVITDGVPSVWHTATILPPVFPDHRQPGLSDLRLASGCKVYNQGGLCRTPRRDGSSRRVSEDDAYHMQPHEKFSQVHLLSHAKKVNLLSI